MAEPDATLIAATADSACGLLDTRDAAEFAERHLRNSTHIPLAELMERSGELPPPGSELRVVAAPGEPLANTQAYLEPGEGRVGWRIIAAISATPALLASADRLGCSEAGAESRMLWSPSPHLVATVPSIEAQVPAARWLAVDLGCGKGRDCVWLARRGWDVVGVDKQQCFITHVETFSRRQGVAERVRTARLDLRRLEGGCEAQLAELLGRAALVNVSRFMHRPLLDLVVRVMPAGCVLAVHAFTQGATSRKSGKEIKAEPGLEPGELRARFAELMSDVLLDDVSQTADGRPICSYVARASLAPQLEAVRLEDDP